MKLVSLLPAKVHLKEDVVKDRMKAIQRQVETQLKEIRYYMGKGLWDNAGITSEGLSKMFYELDEIAAKIKGGE